jgi:hypothetical protein
MDDNVFRATDDDLPEILFDPVTAACRRIDRVADEMGIRLAPAERDKFAILLAGMED